MKTSTYLALAASLLLSSCITATDHRVKTHPDLYAKLNEADKEAVRIGVLHVGMTKETVYLSWGNPAEVTTSTRNGKTCERWSYKHLRQVAEGPYPYMYGGAAGVSFWGRHHAGFFYEPFAYGPVAVGYVAVEAGRVEFVNGRVTSFRAPYHE